jgi:hypothetical protein
VSEFSFQLGFSVAKPLPPISDPLVDVDFCSSTGAAQTPPTLRIQIAASATSGVEGVFSKCFTLGTTQTAVVASNVFGTVVLSTYGLFQNTSENDSSSLRIIAGDPDAATQADFARLAKNQSALLRLVPGIIYTSRAVSTNTTGKLQVTVIGE